MYEELVKRLRDDEAWKNCDFDFIYGWMHEAADAIEALSKTEKTTRWIPVTERLPEIDEKHHCSKDVLAYLKDGGMCFTALEENIFGQACFECERNPAVEEEMIVTHWMPLPEPPKEESNGV